MRKILCKTFAVLFTLLVYFLASPSTVSAQCAPVDVLYTNSWCSGNQMCHQNRWRGSDCSEGWGGTWCDGQVNGVCGYCTPNDQIGTRNVCSGNQQCTQNQWRGSDCSTGWGGSYGCSNVDGQCGYCTPSDQLYTRTVCEGNQLCTQNRWRGSNCGEGWGGSYGCGYVLGQCGYNCVPDAVQSTNYAVCSGSQTCYQNTHTRMDCSTYLGGLYNCSYVDKSCGYCTPDSIQSSNNYHCAGTNNQQWCQYNIHYRSDCTTYTGGDYNCQYVVGQCGISCIPDSILRTQDGYCNGIQTCLKNIHYRSDCSTYEGGLYGCRNVVGTCGYNGSWTGNCVNGGTQFQVTGDAGYISSATNSKNQIMWQGEVVPFTHAVDRGNFSWSVNSTPQTSTSCLPLGTCTLRNCTGSTTCYGSCDATASYNTCGSFSGNINNCYQTGPSPCQTVSTGSQSCSLSINNCDAGKGYYCSSSTCVTTIFGKVYVDRDDSGTLNIGDTIYSGATLTLYNSSNQQLQTTTSGNSGYSFNGITDGAYIVAVSPITGYRTPPSKSVTINVNVQNGSVDFGLTIPCSYLKTTGGDVYAGRGIRSTCDLP